MLPFSRSCAYCMRCSKWKWGLKGRCILSWSSTAPSSSLKGARFSTRRTHLMFPQRLKSFCESLCLCFLRCDLLGRNQAVQCEDIPWGTNKLLHTQIKSLSISRVGAGTEICTPNIYLRLLCITHNITCKIMKEINIYIKCFASLVQSVNI